LDLLHPKEIGELIVNNAPLDQISQNCFLLCGVVKLFIEGFSLQDFHGAVNGEDGTAACDLRWRTGKPLTKAILSVLITVSNPSPPYDIDL
jgi:hypothetical protein